MTSPKKDSPLTEIDEGKGARERSPSDPHSPIATTNRQRTTSQSGRPRSYSNVKRIVLLALDVSENSRKAFEWYLDNLHRPDDLIVLTHIPEVPNLPSFSFKSGFAPPVEEWKKIIDENNTKARRIEEDYEATCVQRKIKYKIRGETFRNVGEGILKIADEELADVICVGARGQSALSRSIIGSVSEYVARNATVPVVIVPNRPITARRRNSMVQHGIEPPQ